MVLRPKQYYYSIALNKMQIKVALVHDYLKEYGGAERVLEVLTEIFPEAVIFTGFYFPQFLGPHRKKFVGKKIMTSFLQKIPLAEKLVSPFRLLAPLAFENFDFSEYDVVIVSATGAYNPNLIITKPETLHLCYCHTPPRYLYGLPTARDWKKHWWGRVVGETINFCLRPIDFASSQRPDYFIANSQNTARRIEKFYRRDSTVIYPPVEIQSETKKGEGRRVKSESYFLAGGRLARAKRIDLAIEACNQLKLPLKIFGADFAGYLRELKQIAGPTIEFVGEVTEQEKEKLMVGAKAYLFTAEEEDFGITPVEAMACGTPVVALRSGGVVESVVEGKTGIFFDEPSVESLLKAIKQFNHLAISSVACRKQAEKFSKDRFKKEIIAFVNAKIKNQKSMDSTSSPLS